MSKRPAAFRPFGVQDRREARRTYDAERATLRPWRGWYQLAAWREIRERQLTDEPFCRFCLLLGETSLAAVCDHVEPHRGDPDLFWSGPFQSLCKTCHDGAKQRIERGSRST